MKKIKLFVVVFMVVLVVTGIAVASEVAPPDFVTDLSGGWVLDNLQPREYLLPFVKVPSWIGTYKKLTSKGETIEFRLTIAIVSKPEQENDAVKFHNSPGIPKKIITTKFDKVTYISWREGNQDSPNASAQAVPVSTTQITVVKPPFILYIDGENVSISEDDLTEILETCH